MLRTARGASWLGQPVEGTSGLRISETCSCGAKIEAESQDEKVVQRVVDKWRRRHSHFTKPERPVQYWPNPYITWTSSTPGRTYNTGTTTSAVTGTSPSKTTQDEDW